MEQTSGSGGVMPVTNLAEYFRDALGSALSHQHVAVEDQTNTTL